MRLNGTVFSKTLDMDTGLTVITPNELKPNYKTVYLLHGLCGNNRTWEDYSLLPVYAAQGNSVYIMPEVARSFYSDMKYGFEYFKYITAELPCIMQNIFNISSSREDTAIIGCSMGGYGALKCALSYPERYGMCAAFSSSCLLLKSGLTQLRENDNNKEFTDNFGKQLITDFKAIFGDEYTYNKKDDLAELLKTASPLPALYLTCGTRDYFYADHLKFCKMLKATDTPFTFDSWDAAHDFIYFNDALKKAIDRFGL